MTAELVVELDPGPLERTRADVLVIFYFESDRPLRGGAGRADWRLCGQLSRLLADGTLGGAVGEAVLIPNGGGLAAPLLIGLGLGARNRFDAESCRALGREAASRARRLGAHSVALPLPDPQAGDLGLRERVESLVDGAAAGLERGPSALRLKLVPAASELPRARACVAALQGRPAPPGVRLRIDVEAAARRSRDPRGAAVSGSDPAQTIK